MEFFMKICGLQNTTLLDFPGKVACTIFTGGCNFRCPFCHNASLVSDIGKIDEAYTEDEIFTFLNKRKNILDGVCITGGEPTLWPDLPDFISKIKETGLLVKLDSNGYKPDVLEFLIKNKLIDYIAMDIKSGESGYGNATGLKDIDISLIKKSISIIMNSGIDYEFRTTLVKGIHTISDIDEIGLLIKGAKNYFLQSYKDSGDILSSTFKMDSFNEKELKLFLSKASAFANSHLRGID